MKPTATPIWTHAFDIFCDIFAQCEAKFPYTEFHTTASGFRAVVHDVGIAGDGQEYEIIINPLHRYHTTPVLEVETDRLIEEAIQNTEIPPALADDCGVITP